MRRAFELYSYCAMALNHLANHFFYRATFSCRAVNGDCSCFNRPCFVKSHSYHNLARSYRSKGDYETTGRYYMASVKESQKPQDFVLPYYGSNEVGRS